MGRLLFILAAGLLASGFPPLFGDTTADAPEPPPPPASNEELPAPDPADPVPDPGLLDPEPTPRPETPTETRAPDGRAIFHVIPIQGQIGRTTLYVVRRGVREAVERQADFIILEMDTPGGGLGETLEIMQILSRFKGTTLVYIDDEAVSAGAFISAATDEIHFAPTGVIGAAAPILAGGQEIEESLRQKIISYLRARVRAVSEEHPYRGEVLSAMIDADYELVIEGEVIKPKGELLSLTARESMREFGDPPRPLLGAGIWEDLDTLIAARAGDREPDVSRFDITWSVQLAQWLNVMSPVFMGIGLLMLFVEFKTPGFGIFGALGIALIAIVFFGHYVAGLSGYEPFLIFLLGVSLILIEVFVLPGLILPGLVGLGLMVGALLWGMAETWPDEGIQVPPGVFIQPVVNLGAGVLMACLLAFIFARFLPRSMIWDQLVLKSEIEGTSAAVDLPVPNAPSTPQPGDLGIARSALSPAGEIEVDGRRYEGRLEVGSAPPGTEVRILRKADFVYIVERARR
ncbi:MAG: hypothetical protein EA425_15065 [Puniceicoccaceae bacterium]|nr:MAG: hypothetical protein EA425_15065 [Puniceicoccaceae bacterium]